MNPTAASVCILLLAQLLLIAPQALASTSVSCAASTADGFQSGELATIREITDGDTVVLSSGQRVRLIGINTPELGNSKNRQAFAAEARDALTALIPAGTQVRLIREQEHQDRHRRVLAHVIRAADALRVSDELLTQGLAAQSAVFPNTGCASHFDQLETKARAKQVGLWGDDNPWHISANELSSKRAGFKIVTGKVTRMVSTKKSMQLIINDKLTLKVRHSIFDRLSSQRLLNATVQVRGWISVRKNKASLWLNHPANLMVLD